MYQFLVQTAHLSSNIIHSLLTEVRHSEVFQGDANVPRTCKDKEWIAAEDNHENTNVKFAIHVQRRILEVPLYYHSFEHSDIFPVLLIFALWSNW